jgi:DNA-binding transcriptional regulator YiaG
MQSKLKERFARLGPVKGVDRVQSGSPVDLVLRPDPKSETLNTIAATMALTRRGMTMLRAKRAVEAVVEQGEFVVHLPTVEDLVLLVAELKAAGVNPTTVANDPIDVRALRERLGLTQEQFALRFNLDLDAVQNWEQGRREPDRAVLSYLRVIALFPSTAALAQQVDACAVVKTKAQRK